MMGPRLPNVPGPVLERSISCPGGVGPPTGAEKLAEVAEAVRMGVPTVKVTSMEAEPPKALLTGTVAR